ncbi:hypothetical protein EXIGLDRAFT_253208 [Exidia glandulosa HHB12029]|uniref:Uncharacterized protein n=1 Tax=Exidia glandulosa HHB12029 TaxID=1314781 RepID=A0A165ZT16_EXIGL|nr:hypothetical protein EXIGLDRAFT_253208 [Exidia glandulosa HHB12029]
MDTDGATPSRPLSQSSVIDVKLPLPPPPRAHTGTRRSRNLEDELLATDLMKTFGEAPPRRYRDAETRAPKRAPVPAPTADRGAEQ